MYNIIICDDEADIRMALKLYLSSENYNIIEAENGKEAIEIIEREKIHLLLMDIMMPVMGGIDALLALRKKGNNIPVILLTAKGQDNDKVIGLNAGADDYITKPFNYSEVSARIKSQIRRYTRLGGVPNSEDTILRNGVLEYNDNAKTLTRDGELINLTPIELMIVKVLMENLETTFSSEEIYRRVWKEEPFGAENVVTVHIRHLREKIEIDSTNPDYIKAKWGQGYKMVRIRVPEIIGEE